MLVTFFNNLEELEGQMKLQTYRQAHTQALLPDLEFTKATAQGSMGFSPARYS